MLEIISSFVVSGLKFFSVSCCFQRKVPGASPVASFEVHEERRTGERAGAPTGPC